MKTPKRAYKQDVCPECRSVVHWYSEEVDNGTGYEIVNAYGECINPDCDFSVKGLRDHDGWEDHQQEARWKRRNREARLRNLIHWQAEDIKWFKGTLKERTEARDWLVVCYRELSRKHDLEGSAFNASGTYGQDIEGS